MNTPALKKPALQWSPIGTWYVSYQAYSGDWELTITCEHILLVVNAHTRYTAHTEKFTSKADAVRAAEAWLLSPDARLLS